MAPSAAMRRPSHATVIAYAALFFAMGGTAVAATGKPVLLGRSNSADLPTSISNVDSGTGPALNLRTKSAKTPNLTVSNGARIAHLNADNLDGLDSVAFQRTLKVKYVTQTRSSSFDLGPPGHFVLCPAGWILTGYDVHNDTVSNPSFPRFDSITWVSSPPAGYKTGIAYPAVNMGLGAGNPSEDVQVTAVCIGS
jgi:hypothetical protein